jgi:hypothetical protein
MSSKEPGGCERSKRIEIESGRDGDAIPNRIIFRISLSC